MPEDSALLAPLLSLLRTGAASHDWFKAVFSHPAAEPAPWDKLTAEPVPLVSGLAVKLVLSARGRVTTRTAPAAGWPAELDALMAEEPTHINLLGRDHDWHARLSKSGRWLVSRGKPSQAPRAASEPVRGHDRPHNHPLPPEDEDVRELFIATGLFGHTGQLRGEAAGKYRQVQHFIELLRPLELWNRPAGAAVRIVDAGCGKAYLSLALYLYARRLGLQPELYAVDREPAVLESVAAAARRLGYERVVVNATDIASFAAGFGDEADLVVSLHACDTATDDAIVAAAALGARAGVFAPCCHHELVAQLQDAEAAGRAPAGWEAILANGLLRHRFADVLTDAFRAAALEAAGYRADTLEFVDAEATSRNLMLRAEQRAAGSGRQAAMEGGVARFRALAGQWGVHPSVERVLAPREGERAGAGEGMGSEQAAP